MNENEVIQNDDVIENVSTNDTNEVSTVQTETQTIINPDANNFAHYRTSVSRYFVDSELFTISVFSPTSEIPLYTFAIPYEYSSNIRVIDGMIYNFGTDTIKLSSNLIKGFLDGNETQYYVTLELPVYKSPEFYACLAESGSYSVTNENPVPYNLFVTFNYEDKLITSEYSIDTQMYFKEDNSPMVGWSLDTIFTFIILILLIGKTVFRKG